MQILYPSVVSASNMFTSFCDRGVTPVMCETVSISSSPVTDRRSRSLNSHLACVHLPCRERPQLLRLAHIVEEAEHLAQLVHGIGWRTFRAVIPVEPLQAPVGEASYLHRQTVACSLTLITSKCHAEPNKGNYLLD